MDKLLEVREFDSIIGNKNYADDSRYKYFEAFNSLVEFVHEYTSKDDSADALDFMRIGYKRNVGDVIAIKNYVGLIQLKNGYQIQVLPKMDFSSGDTDSSKTKSVLLKMLRSMRDFPAKVFNEANLKIDKMNLYEIFINMYVQEVRQLVKRGLKSSYIGQEENLPYLKGKLLFSQQIKLNSVHKENFYVKYDDFNQNRAENRLIKATLDKLLRITTSPENSKEIRQLLTSFELVDTSINYDKDFSLCVNDRSTVDYKDCLAWSKVFLYNKSFSTFSGDTESRALLFPMEIVYESFVAQKIKRIFMPDGWSVTTQDKRFYLFASPRRFLLKPDIVIEKDDRVIILDTKWKRLVDDERSNYGIAQSDMYQMYAYAKKYNTPEIWLLYPKNNDIDDSSEIEFDSGDGVNIKVHFVDVEKIDGSLTELRTKISDWRK